MNFGDRRRRRVAQRRLDVIAREVRALEDVTGGAPGESGADADDDEVDDPEIFLQENFHVVGADSSELSAISFRARGFEGMTTT